MKALRQRNKGGIGDAMARRTSIFKQLELGPFRRQTMQRRWRAKSLSSQRGAVEALQLQVECAGLSARKREEEERRRAQNSLRVFRQLPHSCSSRRGRSTKGLRKIEEILIHAGDAIDLDGCVPRQPRRSTVARAARCSSCSASG